MSRRGDNIFKRNDGRWEARYPKGRDMESMQNLIFFAGWRPEKLTIWKQHCMI